MTVSFIHIERANLEDLPEIWALHAAANRDVTQPEWLAAVQSRACLVAKSGWSVVGAAIRHPDFFGYPLITQLLVHPDHRGRGIARKLLDYAEATSTADRLFITAPATTPNIRELFAALGYQPAGQIEFIGDAGQVIAVKLLPR